MKIHYTLGFSELLELPIQVDYSVKLMLLIYQMLISKSDWMKQGIWISSNEVDETGAYYTEWSKPERKTPIQYTNAYIWNLERW